MSNLSGELVLKSPQMKSFLRTLGIKANPFTELEAFKLACEQANPRYTSGQNLVRFQLADGGESDWPEEALDATLILARYLGMLHGETALTGAYYAIVATAGAKRETLRRLCTAAQAIKDLRATAKVIVVAGSTRPLLDAEKALVQDFAEGAKTESDLCVGARAWVIKRHPELNIVATLCDDPKSGNDGVLDAVVHTIGNGGNPSIAAVTTKIYVSGLHLDMARAAKRHGWSNFLAAGHASDPETIFGRSITRTYASECLTVARKAAIAAAEGC